MTRPLPRLLTLLIVVGALAGAPTQAQAQTTPPRLGALNSWSPSVDDPTYAARKLQRVRQASATAARAATVASAQPTGSARAAAALPACFVPLDTTAAGGWQHFSRQSGFADDSFVGPIPLGFSFSLYGSTYSDVYVNSNGNISFGQGFTTFTATGFPTATPMIAPFWADVDIEMADTLAPATSGGIYFKKFPDKFVVTWNKVAYFSRQADKKNTFQVVIKANTVPGFTGDDVQFAYGDMQWTTGAADGGTGGFGGVPATVGANRGNGVSYIQVGRFNLPGTSHPNNQDPSGVDWLDNQCISFQVGANSNNVPPSVTGMPAGNTLTLAQGQTRNLALQFLGPEVGQQVTVTTNTNGLCNTTVSNNGTANPTVSLGITGAACNLGTHTISFQAVDNGSPVALQQFTLTVVVTATNQWTGAVSTVYTDAANWNTGIVPTATEDVLIPTGVANMPVLSTTAAAKNVTIASGASLTVATGGVYSLSGNLTNNGQLRGAGTLQTTGAATQTLSGTGTASLYNATIGAAGAVLSQPLALDRLLTLNGNLTSNGNLTLLSRPDGSETAMVVNNGAATVSGNVTVQRFIGPTTNPQMGYRHLAAPVTNTTLTDMTTSGFTPVLNPAYNSAPNPGLVTPFPNVFSYDETRVTSGAAVADFDRGWVSPVTTTMFSTFGFTVNMMGGQVMDFVGTLGNGTFNRVNLTRGAGPQAGWQLLGNPYPAPLNFTQLTRSGIDNAVYVFKSSGQYTGSYASYVNGVPANGGSNILPMGQAFFVRTTTPGVAGSVAFTNAARLTTYQNPALQRSTATETRPLLSLDLRNAAGTAAEQMAVYFEQGATAGFDAGYDAYRLGNGNAVQLGALAGTTELSISGLPALGSTPVTVPLLVRVAQTGSYTLQAAQLINLPTGWTATLHDALTGTATDLHQPTGYNCTIAANQAPGRFLVEFAPSRVTATGSAQLSAAVSVYPNPAHSTAALLLPPSARPTTVSLFNALGQVVSQQRVPASQRTALLPLTDLAPGVYTVRVALAEGSVTKRLVVE
ncbi:nidogen-like domain-containing protein [Hymenobacter negativus]|uniref:T9SS type A sorting domain-containing protein n=1 Tax=Hymenobacter negativus TaxID=2795026 RepID=A0ABS3QC23_9BACT|nr:nidogen-like domain-containing protein [Hymenobacter negativus]MBO2008746.1 T9SS type A sorting domain-containing protein [Hymenobacter negativus]